MPTAKGSESHGCTHCGSGVNRSNKRKPAVDTVSTPRRIGDYDIVLFWRDRLRPLHQSAAWGKAMTASLAS